MLCRRRRIRSFCDAHLQPARLQFHGPPSFCSIACPDSQAIPAREDSVAATPTLAGIGASFFGSPLGSSRLGGGRKGSEPAGYRLYAWILVCLDAAFLVAGVANAHFAPIRPIEFIAWALTAALLDVRSA